MNKCEKISIFILRVSMGWLMFYAGVTKIINPQWSAAGYLGNAKTFAGFYQWFLRPDILPFTNFINEWGLTIIGAALMLGIFVRISSLLGALMMILYYFPILDFPYPDAHSFLIDEHIIYAVALAVLAAFRAGHIWGLDEKLFSLGKRVAPS